MPLKWILAWLACPGLGGSGLAVSGAGGAAGPSPESFRSTSGGAMFPPVDGNLSIPKRQVRVSLTSALETVEGYVFTADFSEHTRGAERVGEILNHPEPFLPVRDLESDRVYLYNKQSITCLTVLELERREWEVEELEFSPAERVEITLTTGDVLRGVTYLDTRPEKSRVSDLLNQPDAFVVLVREEGVTYVSKRHILRVT